MEEVQVFTVNFLALKEPAVPVVQVYTREARTELEGEGRKPCGSLDTTSQHRRFEVGYCYHCTIASEHHPSVGHGSSGQALPPAAGALEL